MEQLKRYVTAIDILVIIISVAAISAAIFTPRLTAPAPRSNSFSIDINGDKNIYSLSEDNTIEIESCGIKLTLEVKDGKVSVTSSDCPDGICRSSGKIFRQGQSIVCLPARVAITILSEESGDADWIFG